MTAEQRKQNSEKLLASLGITLSDNLPVTQEENAVQLRSASEVAKRILLLTNLNCIASEPSLREEVMRFLIHEKLWQSASAEEQALFHKPQLTEEEISAIFWRGESIRLLLWAIKKIEVLEPPEEEMDPYNLFPLLPGFFEPTTEFVGTAILRDASDILDRYDFLFRLTWGLSHGNIGSSTIELNADIAYEQYTALDWIINNTAD